jgi:hypothetical protein
MGLLCTAETKDGPLRMLRALIASCMIMSVTHNAPASAAARQICDVRSDGAAFGRCMLRNARDDLAAMHRRQAQAEGRSGKRAGPAMKLQRKVTRLLADHWAK